MTLNAGRAWFVSSAAASLTSLVAVEAERVVQTTALIQPAQVVMLSVLWGSSRLKLSRRRRPGACSNSLSPQQSSRRATWLIQVERSAANPHLLQMKKSLTRHLFTCFSRAGWTPTICSHHTHAQTPLMGQTHMSNSVTSEVALPYLKE